MFILRQFNARINTTYRSMTVICLMLLLAVGITASAVGLNNTVEQMAEEELPQDVSLLFYPDGEEPVDLPALLAAVLTFGRGIETVSVASIVVVTVQTLVLIGSIFPVERALKRNFDDSGRKRS